MNKQEYILCAAIKRIKPVEVTAHNYQTINNPMIYTRLRLVEDIMILWLVLVKLVLMSPNKDSTLRGVGL